MKKSGYILILVLLFLGVAKLLDALNFWAKAGLERPHGYIAQGLIFLGLLFVLQNYLFIPYLRVMEEREAQTHGKKAAAEKTRQEAEAVLQKYRGQLEEARLKAIRQREQEGIKADQEEQSQLAEARTKAQVKYDGLAKEVQQEATQAREKLHSSVDSLTEEIVASVLTSGVAAKKPRARGMPEVERG